MTVATDTADRLMEAAAAGRQIAPITDADPDFDLARATGVAVEILRRRTAAGDRMAGHKLGFTNRRLWDEFGVRAPVWGPVYDSTTAPLGTPAGVSGFFEPKIEPEIVFRLTRAPEPEGDPETLLAAVDGVALGFEIVQSIYPGWKFRAPDTLAAFTLHGALRHGPFTPIRPEDRAGWAARLADFDVTLSRSGAVADTGHSSAVLGTGPVAALAHLARLLAGLPAGDWVAPGQIFTTGTLTRALPAAPGETWEARSADLPLDPISIDLA